MDTKTSYYTGSFKDFSRTKCDYRFHFNGKENDNEVKGNGNSYDFDARIFDPRLGRWLSRDPEEYNYPSWSSYTAFLNNPVYIIDPSGKGGIVTKVLNEKGKTIALKVTVTLYIYTDLKKTQEEMNGIKSNIKDNIEANWNNVTYTDNCQPTATNNSITLPVIFEVDVQIKTRSEVEDMVKNNKIKHGENIIEIVESGGSFTDGNSGFWDLRQQALTGNTFAHEMGHLLEFVNSLVSKLWGTKDIPSKDFPDVATSYEAADPKDPSIMNGNPHIVDQASRTVKKSDIGGLNRGKGVGTDITGQAGVMEEKLGSRNTNKIYKNGKTQ